MKKYLVIILAVLLAFIFLKNKRPADIPRSNDVTRQPSAGQKDITQRVQSFSISGKSFDGNNRWEIEGESADIFSEVVNIHAIKATSYGKEISITLTADEGVFYKEGKDVELRKNVIANTNEGTILKTEELRWLAKAEKIVTDDYVYIQRENMDVSGIGAEAVPDMKKVYLRQDIKMTISSVKSADSNGASKTSKAAKPATIITCDGPLEVDYQNNISHFDKNVIIQDKKGKIFADEVIAYIDPGQKRIYKAEASGNVRIVHKQNISYCDKAIYLADKGRVILFGRPKVVIYSANGLLKHAREETYGSL